MKACADKAIRVLTAASTISAKVEQSRVALELREIPEQLEEIKRLRTMTRDLLAETETAGDALMVKLEQRRADAEKAEASRVAFPVATSDMPDLMQVAPEQRCWLLAMPGEVIDVVLASCHAATLRQLKMSCRRFYDMLVSRCTGIYTRSELPRSFLEKRLKAVGLPRCLRVATTAAYGPWWVRELTAHYAARVDLSKCQFDATFSHSADRFGAPPPPRPRGLKAVGILVDAVIAAPVLLGQIEYALDLSTASTLDLGVGARSHLSAAAYGEFMKYYLAGIARLAPAVRQLTLRAEWGFGQLGFTYTVTWKSFDISAFSELRVLVVNTCDCVYFTGALPDHLECVVFGCHCALTKYLRQAARRKTQPPTVIFDNRRAPSCHSVGLKTPRGQFVAWPDRPVYFTPRVLPAAKTMCDNYTYGIRWKPVAEALLTDETRAMVNTLMEKK